MLRARHATLLLLLAAAVPAARAAGCTDDAAGRCDAPRKPAPASSVLAPRVVEISLGRGGFTPSQVTVPRGVPVRFVITRTDGTSCAGGLRIAELDVEAYVPPGRPVDIVVTPATRGAFPVSCTGEGVAGLLVVG
jgi:heme/copper-type cytochrome/quinol oxidase subunit 2